MTRRARFLIPLVIVLLLILTPACTRRNRGSQNVSGEYTLQAGGLERTYQAISIIHIHGLADQLVKFEGGTVPSPYGGKYTSEGAGGNTSRDFNASEVIWEFFSQHPKP